MQQNELNASQIKKSLSEEKKGLTIFIHSFIFYHFILQRIAGRLEPIPADTGFKPTRMSLDSGRKPDPLEGAHTDTRRPQPSCSEAAALTAHNIYSIYQLTLTQLPRGLSLFMFSAQVMKIKTIGKVIYWDASVSGLCCVYSSGNAKCVLMNPLAMLKPPLNYASNRDLSPHGASFFPNQNRADALL